MVRKLSWRSTRSASAASRAADRADPKAQGNRNIIGWAGAFQAVEEPEPALRKGQRNLSRALERLERRPCRLGLIKSLDQPGDGRGFEQAPDGQLDVERGADAADQPRRQQRVAAQREEVVVEADPPNPSISAKSEQRISSWGVRGARQVVVAVRSGAGSALRSSLPFGVSGRASSTTIAAGTM